VAILGHRSRKKDNRIRTTRQRRRLAIVPTVKTTYCEKEPESLVVTRTFGVLVSTVDHRTIVVYATLLRLVSIDDRAIGIDSTTLR
jgi:RNase P subunit RPR2